MAHDSVLDRLKSGILQFQRSVYPAMRDTYERAAREPQRPSTLFITCSDSRIDVETITQSQPGEVFTARNIGNMVPVYGEMLGGVSAVIEYAVSALAVRHIVVCGHSDCGAMKALTNPAAAAKMPAVESWLSNAAFALSETSTLVDPGTARERFLDRLTECNVLLQLQHLQTHPSVAQAIAKGELSLSGWVYDIGTGSVRIAESGQDAFSLVSSANA